MTTGRLAFTARNGADIHEAPIWLGQNLIIDLGEPTSLYAALSESGCFTYETGTKSIAYDWEVYTNDNMSSPMLVVLINGTKARRFIASLEDDRSVAVSHESLIPSPEAESSTRSERMRARVSTRSRQERERPRKR